MNEEIFRVLVAVILFTDISISAYHRRKADKDSNERVSTKEEGRFIFAALRLGGLLLWFSPIAYMINPVWMLWSKIGLPEWVRWLGVGFGLVCIGLIYWIFSSLGKGISPTVATRKEHPFVTGGPYHWVRHPLYVVGTLSFISLALVADNWFIAVLAVAAFFLLAVRTQSEEQHLIDKFGDEYREYMKTTGRFLPYLEKR